MKRLATHILLAILIFGPIIAGMAFRITETNAEETKKEAVRDLGNGVWVFNTWMEENTTNQSDGWAPMLAKWRAEHPELRIVSVAQNTTTNKVVTSMLVVTEPTK